MKNVVNKKRDEKGFTLVEVLVSLAIFIVGIMGVTKGVQTLVKTGYQTKLMETVNSVSASYLESLSYDEVLNNLDVNESNQTIQNLNNIDVSVVTTRLDSTTPNSVIVSVVSNATGMGINFSRPYTYALVRNLN